MENFCFSYGPVYGMMAERNVLGKDENRIIRFLPMQEKKPLKGKPVQAGNGITKPGRGGKSENEA